MPIRSDRRSRRPVRSWREAGAEPEATAISVGGSPPERLRRRRGSGRRDLALRDALLRRLAFLSGLLRRILGLRPRLANQKVVPLGTGLDRRRHPTRLSAP